MIIEYVDVTGPDPEVLDTVTLDGDTVGYDTGAAEALMLQYIGLTGSPGAAFEALADWSNGYVATRAREAEGS